MNRSLSTWLLGGALCASLGWNWRLARPAAPAGPAQECCAVPDSALLALAPAQERALDSLCESSCRDADRLAAEADTRERELLRAIAAGELDPDAATPRIGAIAELRRDSLAACVEGIFAVRAVLTPEQVTRLLTSCESGTECR